MEKEKIKLPYEGKLKVDSGDYWFNNFVPDIEVDGDKTVMSFINHLLSHSIIDAQGNDYCIRDYNKYDLLLKKCLNANIYFTNFPLDINKDILKHIEIINMIVDTITGLCNSKKINKDPDDEIISSIQINLDTGDKYIFIFKSESCDELQLLYEYEDILYKDIDYKDFCIMYYNYVNRKLTEYQKTKIK